MQKYRENSHFINSKAQSISILRLQALNSKKEKFEEINYKDILLEKAKMQYKVLISAQEKLINQIAAKPKSEQFTPLLASEFERQLQAKTQNEKQMQIQRQLNEFQNSEVVEYIKLVSPELKEKFKDFNRDKVLTRISANLLPQITEFESLNKKSKEKHSRNFCLELFACKNRKLNARLFKTFFKAYAENINEIVELLLEEFLAEEVG